jgi:F-type H+-transporting ATPase subunit gamma
VAGGQERALRRRIRSIESIRKTTRAMELISGSRIVRAQQRILAARPYVGELNSLAADLAAAPGGQGHRMLAAPDPPRSAALVVIASDRGLCGAYNANVLRQAEQVIASRPGVETRVLAVGRRAESYLRFRGRPAARVFTGITDRPRFEDARAVADAVVGAFSEGELDLVEVVSTRFHSAGVQAVERHQVLPVGDEHEGTRLDYELEPGRDDLLDSLARPLAEARLYLALLEAAASEHAARQRTMKAATDNANELITNLRRVMNRARQDSITTEIMDIVGGAEALRKAASQTDGAGVPE